MKIRSTFLLESMLLSCILLTSSYAHAQCGVTMSCTDTSAGTGKTPTACDAHVCFENEIAKKQYEQDKNCKFMAKGLCGDKPLDEAKQCCGKDAKSGNAKIKDRQITQSDSKFDWASYQKECPNMRQSEGKPDALWVQCVVGKKHDPSDDYVIMHVKPFPGNLKARNYCIDGCSTPPAVVNVLYGTGIFLTPDRNNPSGYPRASFLDACAAHDICYQTCGKNNDKATCDSNLLNQSIQACEVIPKNNFTESQDGPNQNTHDACIKAANTMNYGLQKEGHKAFVNRKEQYCQCC